MCAGFFKSPAILPMYYSWIDALSFVKYGYVGASLVELQGLEYTCDNTTATCVETGDQVIDALGLDYINIGGCVGVLIGYIIALRIIGWLGVRWVTW